MMFCMKVATFNVNSLRARLPILTEWLKTAAPDVLCLQETKVQDPDFPHADIEATGYNYVFKGQKTYNGVAILSRHEITDVTYGLPDEPHDEARIITATTGGITIVNTYIPQGVSTESEYFAYKLAWFDRLRKYVDNAFGPKDPLVWCGDLNIAPEPIDVYDHEALADHVCHHPKVVKAFAHVMDFGLVDCLRLHNKDAGVYTFWDYRMPHALSGNKGWRLDHIMATKPLAKKCTSCTVDKWPRQQERPSDHTTLIAEFAME
jgi:exodeoxyribonuclease III